ncbi:MAG TPA: class I SAM-dependent methyltransferase [Terriglobales bacterium]|nr:class I SAM-dependent methyltransferase [Terriglobales bacterium]
MKSAQDSKPQWGSSYRLVATEKWKVKSAAMGAAVTQALIDYASPQAGMQVLDLASGTGEPAISLASHVGSEGRVTALDLSAELLQIAEQRARQRGLDNFSTCQADAQSLPFPDQSFDLVTCRFGVMFFADCNEALREVHRVLRPGGRACFVAWGPFDQPYWSNTMGVVMKHVGGPAILPGDPDPFKFAQPGSLSAALRRAGYAAIEENTETLPWIWPGSEEEVWEYQKAVAVPFRPLLDRVPPEKWDTVNREVHAALGRYTEDGSVKFGAAVVLASGTRS